MAVLNVQQHNKENMNSPIEKNVLRSPFAINFPPTYYPGWQLNNVDTNI